MKKFIFLFVALIFSGCGTVSMTRTVNNVSEDEVKKKLGTYTIIVTDVSREYLNYIKAMDRNSQMGDDTSSAKLQSLQYGENQYYLFEIRHINVYPVKQGDFIFTLKDATGQSQMADILYFEKLYSDTVVSEEWIIKVKKPVTVKQYSQNELPLTLNIKFLGQEMEYKIIPK